MECDRIEEDFPREWASKLLDQQRRAMLWALLAIRRGSHQAVRSAVKPNFSWLKKLTTYLERYSENIHQPNEDHMVLTIVARREPATARTIARLRRDHAAMKGYGNRLRTALASWEGGDRHAGPIAAAIADDYALFCLRHMQREQQDVLPVARKLLATSEWLSAGQAFEAAADPLAASRSEGERSSVLQRFIPS